MYGRISQANAICLHIAGRIFLCGKGYSCHGRPPCSQRIEWFPAATFFGGWWKWGMVWYLSSHLSWLCVNLTVMGKIPAPSERVEKWSDHWVLLWQVAQNTRKRSLFGLQGAPCPMLQLFLSLPWQLTGRHERPLAIISFLIINCLPFGSWPTSLFCYKTLPLSFKFKGLSWKCFLLLQKSYLLMREKKIRELRTGHSAKFM